ncbi:unnamed protein product [Paramecium pentaurelia]|uniref:Uncharacterized protein n=1 Tax=Paramecium pentaurelia TaxID=43138 RepID=A0A8S1U9X6_9CILI|nr:unnamed protein product [Paramecium pentaurelia]
MMILNINNNQTKNYLKKSFLEKQLSEINQILIIYQLKIRLLQELENRDNRFRIQIQTRQVNLGISQEIIINQ